MEKRTEVFDTYWQFAYKRQELFYKRIIDSLYRSNDPILQNYKFTNAYRAADRVSQYLINNVIYSQAYDNKNTFFRIILFKIFNKISTWNYLENELGEINLESYDIEKYSRSLTRLYQNKVSIYSGAYIMASGKSAYGFRRKFKNHLCLIENMIKDEVYEKVEHSSNLKEVYEILKSYPSIGSFLAYQYTIDLNYSKICNHEENSFVVAGPGALSGLKKCFPNSEKSPEYLIEYMKDHQLDEFRKRGLRYKNLYGRDLKLIDCQNLFCEVDKYSRIAHPHINGVGNRTRIKQKFTPNPTPINYFFPPKWNLTYG